MHDRNGDRWTIHGAANLELTLLGSSVVLSIYDEQGDIAYNVD